MDSTYFLYVVLAVALGLAFTVWLFWRRQHVDNKGLSKGVAKYPAEVKKNNPPDNH